MSMSCDSGFNICFTASKCNDGRNSTSVCWILILCECCFTLFLVFRLYKNERRVYTGEENVKAAVSSDMDRLKALSKKSFLSKSILDRSVHASNITELEACPLSRTFRSEENFKKSNRDETILFPSRYPPEYIPVGKFFIIFNNKQFQLNLSVDHVSHITRARYNIICRVYSNNQVHHEI